MDTLGSVLIVDDDAVVLDMITQTLTSAGYQCMKATNGNDAIELIKNTSFEFMLADIVMPGVGGFELAERAKKLHPHLLVIIMTGFIEDFSYDRAIESGASDFIKKPFTRRELMVRMKHVKMQDKVRVMAMTDELTGLLNRRGFFNVAEQHLKLSERKKQRSFMLYIDVDDLKGINDRLGHQEGDLALIDSANLLKATFRDSDIIARIGGDEFVVIPVESDAHGVEMVTTRLQKNLENHNRREKRAYKLSVSFGVSYYGPEGDSSIDELLDRADQSMFEQKKSKRKP